MPELDEVSGDNASYLERKIEKIIYTIDTRIIKIDEALSNLRVEVAKLTAISIRLDKIETNVDRNQEQIALNAKAIGVLIESGKRVDRIEDRMEQSTIHRQAISKEVEILNQEMLEARRRQEEQDTHIKDLNEKIGWLQRVVYQGIGGLGSVLLLKTLFDFFSVYGHFIK
jgi:chromosome segregation ATPase